MRTIRRLVSLLTLSALAALGGIAPLCASFETGRPMACCRQASHCSAGMSARAGCCQVAPSPAKDATPLPPADDHVRRGPQNGTIAMPAVAVAAGAAGTHVATIDADHPPREATVPLYLLNAALLR